MGLNTISRSGEVDGLKYQMYDILADQVANVVNDDSLRSMHLAVFVEPYLSRVLSGAKTHESRFMKRRIAPYGVVSSGDLILLKEASGPVVGFCVATEVWQFDLEKTPLMSLRDRFEVGLAVEPSFWATKATARYGTIIRLANVRRLAPRRVRKKDRRGWVTFSLTQGVLDV